MADPYAQFKDAPQADPWAQFKDAPAAAAPAQLPQSGLQHAAAVAGTFGRHPLTSFTGLAENALSNVTGGAGSLADAVTGADAGTHDWAYRPRTQAGQEIANLGGVEAQKIGQKYDQYAGTGPLASTIKERGPEALGAVGTVTALTSLRGLSGAGKVPVNARLGPTSVLRGDVPGETGTAAAVPEAAAAAERPAGLAQVSQAAPTKEALKAASQAAYKRAEEAGVVITPESFQKAQSVLVSQLEKEGLDPTLHPSTTAALKRISETQGPVTLEKLETLRRIAKSAEESVAPADRRLAAQMVDTLDRYAETLGAKDLSAGSPDAVAALKEARNLWSRSRKADVLDELMSRAELSAPNFSASGMENAVRTEFRALAKNSRRMRMFTKEEQVAIRRVATGGAIENSLRALGKFAPTGVVSTALSTGAGFVAAGPAGAAALPAIGSAARYGASKLTMRNALRANELVRRGPNALARKAPRTTPETVEP